MLPSSLAHSFTAPFNAPAAAAASAAWFQYVAGLRALHHAVGAIQQHRSGSSNTAHPACPEHSTQQHHGNSTLCCLQSTATSHQQQQQQHSWGLAGTTAGRQLQLQRMFSTQPAQHTDSQHQQQQEPSSNVAQQQQLQQQPDPTAADGEVWGSLQSHFRRQRSQQAARSAQPSLQDELARLREQHQQHLTSLVSQHQQHSPAWQKQGARAAQQPLQQQQQQRPQRPPALQQERQQSLQDWQAWKEGLQEGPELLQQQQQQQQQEGGEEGCGQQQSQGKGQPFLQLGVDPLLVQSLASLNMHSPTPVQVEAFPALLSGRNCSIQSPTGTGKTLSYLLPLLTRLQPWAHKYRAKHPQVVVVCPTQELCMQVLRVARALLPEGPKCAQPVCGGSSITKSSQALARHGPLLLVATPGRLAKLLDKRGSLLAKPRQRPTPHTPSKPSTAPSSESQGLPAGGAAGAAGGAAGGLGQRGLRRAQERSVTLVFEEADRLAVMDAFKDLLPQLSLLERRTLDALLNPPSLAEHMRSILQAYQVVMVSASLRPHSLQQARAWGESHPISIFTHTAATAAPAAAATEQPAMSDQEEQEAGEAADGQQQQQQQQSHWALMLPPNITHQVLPYETIHERSSLGYSRHRPLKRLLQACAREGRKVLLFAPQKVAPQQLKQQLVVLLGADYKIGVLHGGQQGQHRAASLAQFNAGKLHALVTSDAFGLGLDYQGVDVVLCLDDAAPTAQAYVARAGRTGRMGRPGTVLTLIPRNRLQRFREQVKRVTKDVQVMELHRTAPGEYELRPQAPQADSSTGSVVADS